MSRKVGVGDINQKIAYMTHSKSGKNGRPIMKTKDPLVLPNRYAEKKKAATAGNVCHAEMMDMLDCLKRNNGYNDKCASQISTLVKCEESHRLTKAQQLKEAKSLGKTVEGGIDPSIANNQLKKNPTIQNKKAWIKQRNLLIKLESVKIQPFPYEDDGRPFQKKF